MARLHFESWHSGECGGEIQKCFFLMLFLFDVCLTQENRACKPRHGFLSSALPMRSSSVFHVSQMFQREQQS